MKFNKSDDSSVGIATGYVLKDGDIAVRVPGESRMCSSPCHPKQFCCPTSFLSNGHPLFFRLGIAFHRAILGTLNLLCIYSALPVSGSQFLRIPVLLGCRSYRCLPPHD
jgi:hypothetical protein